MARVRAALRRTYADEQSETPVIDAGDFHIDIPGRRVEVRKQEVHLTPKEFDVLVYLVRHPDKVVTHRALLSAVWGPNSVEADGISARMRRAPAEETRRGRNCSALHHHRTVDWIPFRGGRLKQKASGVWRISTRSPLLQCSTGLLESCRRKKSEGHARARAPRLLSENLAASYALAVAASDSRGASACLD